MKYLRREILLPVWHFMRHKRNSEAAASPFEEVNQLKPEVSLTHHPSMLQKCQAQREDGDRLENFESIPPAEPDQE